MASGSWFDDRGDPLIRFWVICVIFLWDVHNHVISYMAVFSHCNDILTRHVVRYMSISVLSSDCSQVIRVDFTAIMVSSLNNCHVNVDILLLLGIIFFL